MKLTDVMGQLVAVFTGWDGFLKDPNYIRNNRAITWAGFQNVFVPEVVSREISLDLSRRRQYSFRVSEDDSVVQIAYTFDAQDSLLEARLAYYEVGFPGMDDDELVAPPGAEDDVENLVRWMRIDYCPASAGGVLHTPCHLHLSGHSSFRLPIKGVPTPIQFMELVVSMFYPSTYAHKRLTGDGRFQDTAKVDTLNSSHKRWGEHPDEILRRVVHLNMPFISS
jgi:hypothetical protein